MLEQIKSLILEKKEFQEAASILMEDATNNVEDLIVLNEDSTASFTENKNNSKKENSIHGELKDLPKDIQKIVKETNKYILKEITNIIKSDEKFKKLNTSANIKEIKKNLSGMDFGNWYKDGNSIHIKVTGAAQDYDFDGIDVSEGNELFTKKVLGAVLSIIKKSCKEKHNMKIILGGDTVDGIYNFIWTADKKTSDAIIAKASVKTESVYYEEDETIEEDSLEDKEVLDEDSSDDNDDMELDDDSSEDENETDMDDDIEPSENDFDSDDEDVVEDPSLLGSGDNGNDIDDIMHIEIDLATNTVSDVLPRSPKDASSVVNDDTMSIGVDDSPVEPESDDSSDSSSEFDDIDLDEEPTEEESDIDEKDAVEESFELEDDLDDFFSEAIDIGGGDDSSNNDTPPDEKASEDNTVTSAVKDKVNEANNSSDNNSNDDITFDEDPGEDSSNDNFDIDYGDSDPNAGTEDTSSGGDEDVKSMVIKKLSNITKALEDAKNSVLSHVK